jgi:hypothetical protein
MQVFNTVKVGIQWKCMPKRPFNADEKRLKAMGSEVSTGHLTLLFCDNSKYNI